MSDKDGIQKRKHRKFFKPRQGEKDMSDQHGASTVKALSGSSRKGEAGFSLFDAADVFFDFPENGIVYGRGIKSRNKSGGITVQGMQPTTTTRKYYRDNFEALQSQPELYGILLEHLAKMFSNGVCIVEKNAIKNPTGEFKLLMERMFVPQLSRALIWLFCYSFVVWCDTWIEDRHVIFVPDPSQVQVHFQRDEKTGVSKTLVTWSESDVKIETSVLHFFDRFNTGVSMDLQCSFVDGVSPLIDKLNELENKRFLILDRAARPPIAVQERAGASSSGSYVASDVPVTQRAEVLAYLDDSEKRKKDIETYNRVAEAITNANTEAEQIENVTEVAPWDRLTALMREPYENRFVYVPLGLQAARPDTHPPDLNHNQALQNLNLQIRKLMGVPLEEGMPTTEIQKMLQDSLGHLASEMIKVLYPSEDVEIVLKNRILEDRDMAAQLLLQGGISKEAFDMLHPPLEDRNSRKRNESK